MDEKQLDLKIDQSSYLDNSQVKFYWQIESKCSNESPIKQLVLPSLNIDLIFIIQGSLYVNKGKVKEPFVSPVLIKWKEIELKPGTILFGIRFNPIYFHLYSGIELDQLDQAPNSLKYILSDKVYISLSNIVFLEEDFEGRVIKLTKYFHNYFKCQKEFDFSLIKSLDLISDQADIAVGEIATLNGYTERWIQKIFKRKIGINPSKVIQISRFNRFLRLLVNKSFQQLSEASYEAGYSDQSHLIHDFKKFTSRTPKYYLNEFPRFIEIMNCK